MSERDEYLDRISNFNRISRLVIAEQVDQIKKWGIRYHDSSFWLTILMEEVGEAANCILEGEAGNVEDLLSLRGELIQVAAVAQTWIDCIDLQTTHKETDDE